MNAKEKVLVRLNLGLALQMIIKENKDSKASGKVTSLRKLAASSGVEYAIIQKISSGKKDPQFTTMVALVEGFEMTMTEFISYYDKITFDNVRSPSSFSPKSRKGNAK